MLRVHSSILTLLLTLTVLAGCLGDEPAPVPVVEEGPLPVPDYVPVDAANLTKKTFDVLPRTVERIQASIDGIDLYLEVHLPDTDEPVPTILHSSPYNALERVPGGYPDVRYPYKSMVEAFVPRGYAVVVADVRGFGESDGCVEVWGKNEQQDQYDLVQWIAAQPWSDGKVAMEGASYPGTTPVEAAVMAPPNLTTVVVVAGLTDPYYDWHYGGVPNGESGPVGSPAAYHAIGAVSPVDATGGADWLEAAGASFCDAVPFSLEAFSSNGVYTAFYDERNFSARAKNVQVPVLYTEGFRDSNVKPSQILGWFNALDVPKKAYLGQWAHQYPVRDDWKDILHAWFDHHLKGIDNGVMDGPTVEVVTNKDTWRGAHVFPDDEAARGATYLVASGAVEKGRLSAEVPDEGAMHYTAERVALPVAVGPGVKEGWFLKFEGDELDEDLYLSGVAFLRFTATLEGGTNTYFRAQLYEVEEDGNVTRIVFGGLNAALRDSVREYKPAPEGEQVDYTLAFQPREYIVEAGSRLRLVIDTYDIYDSTTDDALDNVQVTIHMGGDKASRLDLPVIVGRPDVALPWKAE
ncbi:MAG: CocE/NonD family hydrolase [Euryarchaeota archaeon]|nr:CocE/NonD family hydrolase [Euryarchaeota archaeon]